MKKTFRLFILGLMLAGCKKPYAPPAISTPAGYLVVEGVINPGPDSTIIKLSRTVNVSSKTTSKTVTGAVLTVESDQNGSYPLTDQGNGYYISTGLNLNTANKYRLRIKTNDGKVYISDFETVLITPPIDSVGFNITTAPETGIQVYANAHDATNQIHYFRWDYDEAWQFYSKYISNFISNGVTLVDRTAAQEVSFCYANDVSDNLVLGSTAKLTQDIIYQDPIVFIPSTSEKIESRYSILLRQYALTADAYTFYTNLKKNTEQLGSIFDAQPSEIQGNIHCLTNPLEQVIGYLGISTVSSKRIYIANAQLPQWVPDYPYGCSLDTAKVGFPDYHNLIVNPDIYLATDAIGPILSPVAYLFTNAPLCRLLNKGFKNAPAFLEMRGMYEKSKIHSDFCDFNSGM
jgi:hypothetical protein